jgi:hypothetical protein
LRKLKHGASCGHAAAALSVTGIESDVDVKGVSTMGKYLLGWVLGVPVIVLVIIYMLFN